MGGYSNEYKISLKSGKVVFETLKNSNYNCFQIHVLKDKWVYVDESKKEFKIDKNSFTIIEKPEIKFDCAFNAVHGSPGEDGLLHEYFSKLNIPMSGCSEFQARLTFDKIKCLEYLKPHGIKCAKSSIISKGEKIDSNSIVKNGTGIKRGQKGISVSQAIKESKTKLLKEMGQKMRIDFTNGLKVKKK